MERIYIYIYAMERICGDVMRLCGRDAAEVEAFEGPRFEPCESDVVFGPWFSFVLFVLGSWLNPLKLGTIFVRRIIVLV